MVELAQEEVSMLSGRAAKLEERCRLLLLPQDPMDERNIMLEVGAVLIQVATHATGAHVAEQVRQEQWRDATEHRVGGKGVREVHALTCSPSICAAGSTGDLTAHLGDAAGTACLLLQLPPGPHPARSPAVVPGQPESGASGWPACRRCPACAADGSVPLQWAALCGRAGLWAPHQDHP